MKNYRLTARWLIVMTLSSLFVARFVMMLYAQSVLNRTVPDQVNLTMALVGTFLTFWDHRMSWQGGGAIPMVLSIVFGITAGLARRKSPLRLAPLLLGVATLIALPIYLSHVTLAWTPAFWENLFWRVLALVAVLASGVAIDRTFDRPFEGAKEASASLGDRRALKV